MLSRRELIRSAALYAGLTGVAITSAACAADEKCGTTACALRSPLQESTEHEVLLRELVRCATLAANGHNTQLPYSLRRPVADVSV